MNENIKKWLTALRSGKYSQGTESLFYKGRHCALGVLREVALENGVKIQVESKYSQKYYDNRSVIPPKKVLEWAGIESVSEIFTLNDEAKLSFSQIADYIEANPNFGTIK